MSPPLSLEHWLSSTDPFPPLKQLVGLDNVNKALILAEAFARSDEPHLVVFANRGDARSFYDHLLFFLGQSQKDRIHYFPHLEFDFFRGIFPNPETIHERNTTLFHAANDPKGRLFITSLHPFLSKVVTPEAFRKATRTILPNTEFPREEFLADLVSAGYQRQPTAFDPGVFAVRGSVVDVFSPLYTRPLRIEFYGDLVDEIRFFEIGSQRSLEKIEKAHLVPVKLSLIPRGEEFKKASHLVKERLDNQGISKIKREEILLTLQDGVLNNESIYLFPLLSGGSSKLLEYFPANTKIFWDGRGKLFGHAEEQELPKIEQNFELFEKELHPIALKQDLFLTKDELSASLESGVFLEDFGEAPTLDSFPLMLGEGKEHIKIPTLVEKIRKWKEDGYRVNIVSHTQTHSDKLQALLSPYRLVTENHRTNENKFPLMLNSDFELVHLWEGYLSEGRIYPNLRLVVIAEEEIFGRKKRTTRSSQLTPSETQRLLSQFRELRINDFVVHKDFGIAKYLGLKAMTFQEIENDYAILEYKDGDKLYIPAYRLNVIQKYVGAEGAAPALDKLGGDRWQKAKSRAERAVGELAEELLKIQAKRKLVPGTACSPVGSEYQEFEMEFPFDETPDQQRAIDDVMNDLDRPYPMDRLICGDVGYGKTEVAMRASFRAIIDGHQVAVLVPTTLLAYQHYQNFVSRFKSIGTRIEMVSRLKSPAEAKKILEATKEGKVDILIGTHRLLSADIEFRNLQLIVIDEEHRFGVLHKEKLRKFKETAHILTMTATPIPRTLNMAMAGIKDISIITTPPPDRLSVRTFVCKSTEEVVIDAIANEVAREGQVFFVHNRIQSIFGVADDLKKQLPKVRFEVVHGQMESDELEKRMLRFYKGEAQVLVTTAIIESGLDIPRANTIIIDDAQIFGLAQLYQLRGRVGRSEKRAFCYLLIPGEGQLNEEAKQRIQVIQRYTELGAGFSVASHDLEIRGAGDLLGKDQSGHLNAIGVDLYFDLLEESLKVLRGEEKENEIEPEISMKVKASFPNDYLPDISERILLYRRMSGVKHEEEISQIEQEIRDRFGPLPEEVLNLLGLMRLKIYLKKLHVVRMSSGPKKTSLQFAATTPASPEKLVKLITSSKETRYSLTPDQKLVYETSDQNWKGHLEQLIPLCRALGVEV